MDEHLTHLGADLFMHRGLNLILHGAKKVWSGGFLNCLLSLIDDMAPKGKDDECIEGME